MPLLEGTPVMTLHRGERGGGGRSQWLLAVVSGRAALSGLSVAEALALLPDMAIVPVAAILGSSGPGLT